MPSTLIGYPAVPPTNKPSPPTPARPRWMSPRHHCRIMLMVTVPGDKHVATCGWPGGGVLDLQRLPRARVCAM